MKAIKYTEYGPQDVLQFTEVAKPAPKDDEVLIRIRAASVNPLDWHLPGDEVFGACRGAFAEYVCVIEDKLALKPASISFEDAAAVPVAALTALQGLRNKGRIRRGQRVLVDGASGGVGRFAVQIAKSFGT